MVWDLSERSERPLALGRFFWLGLGSSHRVVGSLGQMGLSLDLRLGQSNGN